MREFDPKVLAENMETEENWLLKLLFADYTGDGTIGYLAGAEYLTGRERKRLLTDPLLLKLPII